MSSSRKLPIPLLAARADANGAGIWTHQTFTFGHVQCPAIALQGPLGASAAIRRRGYQHGFLFSDSCAAMWPQNGARFCRVRIEHRFHSVGVQGGRIHGNVRQWYCGPRSKPRLRATLVSPSITPPATPSPSRIVGSCRPCVRPGRCDLSSESTRPRTPQLWTLAGSMARHLRCAAKYVCLAVYSQRLYAFRIIVADVPNTRSDLPGLHCARVERSEQIDRHARRIARFEPASADSRWVRLSRAFGCAAAPSVRLGRW